MVAGAFQRRSTFGLFSVSQNGVLAYADAHLVDVQPTWYDRQGKVLGTIGEPGEYGTVRLSPDDKRAALERTGAKAGLWLLDVATGIPTRLTFGAESDPVWSPDGRELVFADTSGTLHRRVIGKNADEVLLSNGDANYPKYWTPDGAAILFIKDDGRSLYRLPLSGSRRPELLLETPFSEGPVPRITGRPLDRLQLSGIRPLGSVRCVVSVVYGQASGVARRRRPAIVAQRREGVVLFKPARQADGRRHEAGSDP